MTPDRSEVGVDANEGLVRHAAAVDCRTLERVIEEVRIKHSPEMDDDDQGPFLRPEDVESVGRAVRERLWGQHQAHVGLFNAAERASLKFAPIMAVFRDKPGEVTADQYDDALEALSGLNLALSYHPRPKQP